MLAEEVPEDDDAEITDPLYPLDLVWSVGEVEPLDEDDDDDDDEPDETYNKEQTTTRNNTVSNNGNNEQYQYMVV